MCRDIINAPALQFAIDEALEGLPPVLRGHRSVLGTAFRQAAQRHQNVRIARRRKTDPGWAQRKFVEGKTLYRFQERERDDLISTIREQFDDLEQVAVLAASDSPLRSDAAAFLRGLPHRAGELDEIGTAAWQITDRAQVAALRARRYEALRQSAEVTAGDLIATLCVSIDAVIRLGREAGNCLAKSETHWRRVAEGESDIWSIRNGNRVVAVLEVDRNDRRVMQAQGPGNVAISARDIHQVAQFCRTSEFSVDEDCDGLLSEFADDPVVGPTVVVVKGQVALYVEWPHAVRIDVMAKRGSMEFRRACTLTLALAFNPGLSCGEDLLVTPGLDEKIKLLGRRKVRRVVQAVALAGPGPTLVQHRLLALAA